MKTIQINVNYSKYSNKCIDVTYENSMYFIRYFFLKELSECIIMAMTLLLLVQAKGKYDRMHG